ncbi:hypothetical protein HPP92_004503 [Vanilla planifolia]|uniref:BHLH domain-containing protein n=1 Tax=Vanilla planifolia TaxID=51239 RepID=A0A835VAG0_VANPL|nr:hypothetical protein HPP92_004503 [Vanilla planifolia]
MFSVSSACPVWVHTKKRCILPCSHFPPPLYIEISWDEAYRLAFFLEIPHSGPHSPRNLSAIRLPLEMKGREEKIDRKTVEKNRRMQMKNLCFKLASLIPKQEYISKDAMSQHDHLDQAAAYILKLRHGIERLKQRKESKPALESIKQPTKNGRLGFKLPVIEVRHQEPNLEVLLISGLEKRFAFHEVIGILEEEGLRW